MNYKPLIKKELSEMVEKEPDLTFGELLYSFLRPKMLQNANQDVSKVAWLKDITDEDIYFAMERFQKSQKSE